MWQVDNGTPYAAAGSWIRDRQGAHVWLVAVRCTFRVGSDGTPWICKKQVPPDFAPVYRGDPAATSLFNDSDFCLAKPTTDVLLHGSAYAPPGQSATQVDVALRVGSLSKTLRVTGDRRYEKGPFGVRAGPAQPFTQMPILYERAYGGREPDPPADSARPRFERRNPVGSGFAPVAGKLAPNIAYPSASLAKQPAGFGPLPSHWSPRVGYAGTYDDAWEKEQMPLYPKDLHDRFFLSAPEDQQPAAYLRGGEPVELLNLTASGRLAFVLPRIAFRFETDFQGKPSVAHRAELHKVILKPDARRVILVWLSALPVPGDVVKLMRTRVRPMQVVNPPPGSVPAGIENEGDAAEEGGG